MLCFSETTPSNVTVIENGGEGFDGIIADKVERPKTPEFFPPKKEPEKEPEVIEPEKVSQRSRTSSVASEQTKKARKGSKSLAKFDLSMGVKKEKKESGFGKFLRACTGGKKKQPETIDNNDDPQRNPPASP